MSQFFFPWEQTVDGGKFRCWVEQDTEDGYSGTLRVEVVETHEVILSEPVGIAYAAQFGPDVSDVAEWQGKSIRTIDAWLVAHGEAVPADE